MALALGALLREKGHSRPVIGVDGLEGGQARGGRGSARRHRGAAAGRWGEALRTYRDVLSGEPGKVLVPEDGNILLKPESYPPLEELRPFAARPQA